MSRDEKILEFAGRLWVLLLKLRPLLDRLPWDVNVGAARQAVDQFIEEGRKYWRKP